MDNDATTGYEGNYPISIGNKNENNSVGEDVQKLHYLPSAHVANNTISNVDTGGGDFKVGIFIAPNATKIAALIEAGKAMAEGSLEYDDLMEELNSYQKPRPGREIIGLEGKLNNANMSSLLDDATYLKGEAIKKITRYQFQSHKAALHNYIYGKIYEIFNTQILPLLHQGKTADEINKFISNLIVLPLADEICEADPTINSNTIRGMLYILTGNCHLAWK